MRIELKLAACGNLLIDLGGLQPSEVLSLSTREIEKQPIIASGFPALLGDHFKVVRTRVKKDELVLSGDTERIVSAGRGMESGRLVIAGNCGPCTGAEMAGGELEVCGDAGDCLGEAMHGGLLRVHGNAGDWCAAARPGQAKGMTGGTLLVGGNAGREAGAGMNRGLLVIGGSSSDAPGAHLLTGTILCLGSLGSAAGLGMKRGSLVAGRSGQLLPGFRPAGEADPEWLRILIAWLGRLGVKIPPAWNKHPPLRFTGDHLVVGKGEILIHELLE